MRIDWWTLGLQAINALVLVWLLGRFLFRPIARILAERQAAADRIVAEAEAAKEAADAARAQAEAEAEELAASRNAMIKAATEDAEKQKATMLEAARADADRLRSEARAEIAKAQKAAEDATDARAAQLAVDLAAKLLERLPDSARIAGFVDGLAEGVTALPEDLRKGLGVNGAPIAIAAARPLTDAERTLLRDALGKALGRDVAIDVTVAPDLIAGLELSDAHAEIRNSFGADLERLQASLTRHDDDRS